MKSDWKTRAYWEIIKKCTLFDGVNEDDLSALLSCLSAVHKVYEKNQMILMAGEPLLWVGMVLSGSVHITQEDFWGNRTLLEGIQPGGLFGEALSCAEVLKPSVNITAVQVTEVMQLDCRRILVTCSSACVFHSALIKNLIRILARKNVMLTKKMEIITRRTTRDKLLAYLSSQARQMGSPQFSIPFNRQELADYLSVDRSAMSVALSGMRNEGILKFHRNYFELLETENSRLTVSKNS